MLAFYQSVDLVLQKSERHAEPHSRQKWTTQRPVFSSLAECKQLQAGIEGTTKVVQKALQVES